MVVTIKNQFKIYSQFKIDVWGIVKSLLNINNTRYEEGKISRFVSLKKFVLYRQATLKYADRFTILVPSFKISKICLFFWKLWWKKNQYIEQNVSRYIYRFDTLAPVWKKKRIRKNVFSLKFIKLFYLIFNYRQFQRLARKATSRSGSFIQNYIRLLEGRLMCILYRTGFFAHFFETMIFVQGGNVWVENKYISNLYAYIWPMQIIGFRPIFKGTVLWRFLRRANRYVILFGTPKYMYISYTFLLFFLKRGPNLNELVNPISVDMLRAATYIVK